MIEHLSQCQRSILIGESVDYPAGYYSCSLDNGSHPVEMGIITNQPETPILLLVAESQKVFVGKYGTISIFNLFSESLELTISLEGAFYEFVYLEKIKMILSFHELGCVALSEKGDVLWEYSTDDVLEDWNIVNDQITFNEMDCNEISKINLLTGAKK